MQQKQLEFKVRITEINEREYATLPDVIGPQNCNWPAGEFCRRRLARSMRKNGSLPKIVFFDELPDHMSIARKHGTLTVLVNISAND